MPKLRANRELTAYGGYGVARQLRVMESNNAVFWSKGGNSYVVVEGNLGPRIASINGIGEVRWYVEDWNRDAESNEARRYFLEEETK